MATVYDVLDDLRAAYPGNQERGAAFERLIQGFLSADPIYTERFEQVWRWQEWPDRKGMPDTGIDLVARTADGGYCAIQCKFYEPHHRVSKEDMDSFFSTSGKHPFTERLVVSTTDKWSSHAEDLLDNQQIPVARIGIADLADSPVDWTMYRLDLGEMRLVAKKTARPHQVKALAKVFEGFETSDRGRLIMACGTGKTFTALKAAERVATEKTDGRAHILFLVPSISLLDQTLREWTVEAAVSMRSFAVCSDTKVGKRALSEDIRAHDLAYPATTNSAKLVEQVAKTDGDSEMTVVFSTYQSIDAVAAAQKAGLPEFDLIVCDEAHRTTGVTLADEDESAFQRIHDPGFVLGRRRLYMTATPRIFAEDVKSKAFEHDAALCSMDDETLFGPEFHRLGFGEAVEGGLLTDYKVLVLNVDEGHVAKSFQMQLADDNYELKLDDAAKIVGCWNGLAKRGGLIAGDGFGDDVAPMRRAVAFSRSIKDSKAITAKFQELITSYTQHHPEALCCEVEHVDGHNNAIERKDRLAWLKAETAPNVCRILSNAKCLSEGVDVPDLDAVLFLNPRNSVVDVVQSVGRVMRLAEGKKYGYIILPVGIPAGMDPATALRDNKRYKVVWQVLQALRAHDDRFNAMVNQIELNKKDPKQIDLIGVGGGTGDQDPFAEPSGDTKPSQGMLDFPIEDWRDAIYGRIVAKVGERTYWEQWADDIRVIAERHVARIQAAIADPGSDKATAFDAFVEELRANLNPGITRTDAVDMLAQHLITRPVFDALFGDYDFSAHNPVSQTMQAMLDVLEDQALGKEAETLESFYASVRARAEGIDNHEGRQTVITELYERFFKKALPKTADAFGIVYTPIPVVDFILRATNDALKEHFDTDLSAEGVQILDPFTGTGTFIVRLLQSGLIRPEDLLRKYTSELHANEILLLAYYIAAINIEAAFHQQHADGYTPFEGIVLTDTFQMAEDAATLDAHLFPENNKRVARQKSQDIRVIIGNPPYSVGQSSANDANRNQAYSNLDRRIEETYVAQSGAVLSRNMYDSYVRAFRWASDRIGSSGIICFVSNGSWIDTNSSDGMRKSLVGEFDSIYVFNLRGDQRTSDEKSRKEGGKIFGSGSRNSVAVTLLVRAPTHPHKSGVVFYRDIGDYLSREQKLAILDEASLGDSGWQPVTPNAEGDWLNQRDDHYASFRIVGHKPKRGEPATATMFKTYSLGVSTNRDAWCWNYSTPVLRSNVNRMVDKFNAEVERFRVYCTEQGLSAPTASDVEAFIDTDPRQISWSRDLRERLRRKREIQLLQDAVRVGVYRPFCRQNVFLDRSVNEVVSLIPQIYPTGNERTPAIAITTAQNRTPFAALMIDAGPCLGMFMDPAQIFPRYHRRDLDGFSGSLFEISESTHADNIDPDALTEFRSSFGADVESDDLFYYVYGLLHSDEYRSRFRADLTRSLPRIPRTSGFRSFVEAGRALADLHLGYEAVKPHPLSDPSTESGFSGSLRVEQMRYLKSSNRAVDRSAIKYNADITLYGIPDAAHRYRLGSRSALDWIMDRYQVKTDRASGIVNDPNDWCAEVGDPRYIIDLVKRIVTVSIETMKIVDALPPLEIID